VNTEFEREYLLSINLFSGPQKILGNVLLQEYYEEVTSGRYEELITRLQRLTLGDLRIITELMREIPLEQVEKLTGIPASEIKEGIKTIRNVGRDIQNIIEHHYHVLLHNDYADKLEKLHLSPEELYLVEFFLLKLSSDEIVYIGSKADAVKAARHEKETHVFLEQLQQSYAHIEQLQSHRYFLIQLYLVSVSLILERKYANPFTKIVVEIGNHQR